MGIKESVYILVKKKTLTPGVSDLYLLHRICPNTIDYASLQHLASRRGCCQVYWIALKQLDGAIGLLIAGAIGSFWSVCVGICQLFVSVKQDFCHK